MPKLLIAVLLAALGFGAYYFFTHYQVKGLTDIEVAPVGGDSGQQPDDQPQAKPLKKKTLRIASANLGPLDSQKLNRQDLADRLVEIVRQYDVLAIQGVHAHNQGLMLDLTELVNQGGRQYDFAVSPRVGREPVENYAAFLFDRTVVEIDRSTVCEVDDPTDQFLNRPLVAAFRARGPEADEAFTFTLVNVEIDPTQVELELGLLAMVFRAARDDGRGEDDVLVLGSLGAGDERLSTLINVPHLMWAIGRRPSTTLGTRLVDNILFDSRATVEVAGRSGVFDLMRHFDLTIREAVEISDHLPVWAEFSVFEGGQMGPLAEKNPVAPR